MHDIFVSYTKPINRIGSLSYKLNGCILPGVVGLS